MDTPAAIEPMLLVVPTSETPLAGTDLGGDATAMALAGQYEGGGDRFQGGDAPKGLDIDQALAAAHHLQTLLQARTR